MAGKRCLACMEPMGDGMTVCPNCGSPFPCAPNPDDCLPRGYLLANRFTIGRVIGRGGYGITYIAFDNRLQFVRCVKEYFPQGFGRKPDMTPDVAPGREREFNQYADRFLQEARIMTALSGDKVRNVVSVFDQLNLNGTTYILMEYLDGCTMDEWITRRKQPLDWHEALEVGKSVAQTLEEIHQHGYLHRDMSLSNIFRLQDGGICLIDFGSAEPVSVAATSPEKLWPSRKRFYSPPEQITKSAQGPWTDIYAAGASMFKMLAGGWPKHLRDGESFPSLREMGVRIPEGLDRVICKATQADPKKRYQSAADMLEALNKAGTGEEKASRKAEKTKKATVRVTTAAEPDSSPMTQVTTPVPEEPVHEEWKPERSGLKKGIIIAAIAALAVTCVAGIVVGIGKNREPEVNHVSRVIITETNPAETTPEPEETAGTVVTALADDEINDAGRGSDDGPGEMAEAGEPADEPADRGLTVPEEQEQSEPEEQAQNEPEEAPAPVEEQEPVNEQEPVPVPPEGTGETSIVIVGGTPAEEAGSRSGALRGAEFTARLEVRPANGEMKLDFTRLTGKVGEYVDGFNKRTGSTIVYEEDSAGMVAVKANDTQETCFVYDSGDGTAPQVFVFVTFTDSKDTEWYCRVPIAKYRYTKSNTGTEKTGWKTLGAVCFTLWENVGNDFHRGDLVAFADGDDGKYAAEILAEANAVLVSPETEYRLTVQDHKLYLDAGGVLFPLKPAAEQAAEQKAASPAAVPAEGPVIISAGAQSSDAAEESPPDPSGSQAESQADQQADSQEEAQAGSEDYAAALAMKKIREAKPKFSNSSLPGVILQVRTTAQVTGVRVVSSDGSRTWEAERRQVNQAGNGQKFGYIWIVMDSGLPQAGTYVVEYQLGDSQMTEKFTWDGK